LMRVQRCKRIWSHLEQIPHGGMKTARRNTINCVRWDV
jgi:hypothetical protein